MQSVLLLGLILFGTTARAANGPTITSVSGASGYISTGTPTIYAGLGGKTCSGDGSTPCNSCTIDNMDCSKKPLCPCNQSRIYNNLTLTIGLATQTTDASGNTTTTPSTGNAYVTASSSNTGTGSGNTTGGTVTLAGGNNNGGSSVAMTWQTICGYAGGAGDCEAVANGAQVTLNIYVAASTNGQSSSDPYTQVNVRFIKPDAETDATYGGNTAYGIGSFTPYPGDSKIYIKDPQTTQNFPSLGYNATIRAVRVFVSETNLTDANATAASTTKDLSVTDDGSSLAKNTVDGLTNGTRYYFRLGMLDEAQNVAMYSPDPAVDTDAANTECATPSGGATSSCKYSATPDEVQGLLPEDFNCFVATAAYGTMLEPKLVTFREFRRRVLLSTAAGRKLNHLYYRYGPYAARFITDKPNLRAFTRLALWPAFVLSWLSVRFGFVNVTLAMLVMLAGAVGVLRRGTRARA